MIGSVVPSTQANTLLGRSGTPTELIVAFKFNVSIPVAVKVRIEVSSSADAPQWRRVAQLARIRVTDDEIYQLRSELSSILSYLEQLDEVNVDDVEPLTTMALVPKKMRKDEVTDGDIADSILANAPAHEDHFFLVPKVVE
jgi:aspartyl-tRNA(Asn)/glutamyl-tRNA(Gln) amidotransferase subunit C